MIERRSFLASLAATAFGGLALPHGRADARPAAGDGKLLLTPATAWAPRADGIEIVWAVSRLARGRVEIRAPGGPVATAAADDFGFVPQSAGVMRVRVDGLAPGTAYEWRAVVEAIDGEAAREETPWRSFRTLDPAAAETTFCIWNDTHENHETIRRLQELTPPADFLLWNGDTCNDWKQEDWLVPTLLAPAGLDVSEGHPLLLTFGNHDVRGKFAFRMSDHVALPEDRPYYAFRSGPVAFVALNTGEDKPDDHPSFEGRVAFQRLREEQAAWLERTIARPEMASAPYRVVFCHIPLRWLEEPEHVDYAGTGFDHYARSSRDLWHDSLVEWGAQVVVSGHTHRPASIPAGGAFPYAQMIGGGPRPAQATWIEGRAGADGLTLAIRRVETGETIHLESFPRLS
jgi:3',5'-cyclic AMP phosphodiesterase CpdA